ncbi:PREDICTED: serine protease 42-like [Papilio polytes]|uniref:serine protease 42-like n=1 Tax=Papilio polytes TaxID=76194 RepID=UPI0006760234|nr:PREDICTED: serine protease 42-like [Papilio polytes]
MLVYFLLLGSTLAYPQVTIKPDVLVDVFGTPPTTKKAPGLEDITVRPTDSTSTFVDSNGDACKCVPYYLCDTNLNAVDAYNETVTGAFKLDIRFGVDECQESVERCCKDPKPPQPPPEPDTKNLKGCGYRNRKGIDFSITGGFGSEAQFGEFPWVVALLDSVDGRYAGVGALIHPQVVITGAHIASKFQPGGLKIRAGEWDTQTNKERLPSQERIVQEIYLHPEFHSKSLRNDLALLLLKEPVQLADHINVICLPSQDELFETSRDCVANGWGKDSFGKKGSYAVILKLVELNMVRHQTCAAILKSTRLGYNFRLHDSFVCAGGEEGKDTCQGDGGAPLACPVGDDRYKLTGLVAWGIGCGEKGVPAVYVNVSKYRALIDSKMAVWGFDTSANNV